MNIQSWPRRWTLSDFLGLLLCSVLSATALPESAQAYITHPVTTLGQLCDSTYITVVRVEKVSKEKGIIIYQKVKDIKGKYPKDQIRHAFDLKNTPAHKGPGDVPIRPDEKDWQYALQWAEPGKTAVMFTLKYDPYGDFGHTYIDGCWYATMCPRRDWDFWYSIYTDHTLLSRWHCGTPAQLVSGLDVMMAKKEAIVPVLVGGTKDDLRLGKAKIQGLKVSLQIRDYNPKRDLVEVFLGKNPDSVPIVAPWPYSTGTGKEYVIRSAAELLAASPHKPKDRPVPEGAEQRTMAEIAKALKVKQIDWKTQMLIVIRLQEVHPKGIEMGGLEIRDGELIVRYDYWRPVAGRPQDPSPVPVNKAVMVLVDRFDGKVRFARVERTLK